MNVIGGEVDDLQASESFESLSCSPSGSHQGRVGLADREAPAAEVPLANPPQVPPSCARRVLPNFDKHNPHPSENAYQVKAAAEVLVLSGIELGATKSATGR